MHKVEFGVILSKCVSKHSQTFWEVLKSPLGSIKKSTFLWSEALYLLCALLKNNKNTC